jgi:hypothetical protein
MKINIFFFALLMISCSKESTVPAFDVKKLSGTWVPYEIVNDNNVVLAGPFTGNSIFGVYDESIRIKENGTYSPAFWRDKDNYQVRSQEGSFEYISKENKLIFKEIKSISWDMEFEFVKITENELWLKSLKKGVAIPTPFALYKLKREMR